MFENLFSDSPSRHEFNELLRRFNHFKRATMTDLENINGALAAQDDKVAKLATVNRILLDSYGALAAQVAALVNAGQATGTIKSTDVAALLAHIAQTNNAIDEVSAADVAAVAPVEAPVVSEPQPDPLAGRAPVDAPAPAPAPVDAPAPAADPVV